VSGSRVRLGFVGCGAIATAVHLRNARRIPGVAVTAVADPRAAARARAGSLAPAAARLESAEELVEREDVDAVVVASSSISHAAIGVQVLAAGKHLYLEKPVATEVDQAEDLASAAAGAGVVAVVGFNRRLHPLVLEARERLRRGDLDTIVGVRSWFEEPLSGDTLPDWKRRRETGGGAPLDLGSHHVDLVRYLLGVELVALQSELRSVRSEFDDCTLQFLGAGRPVTIACSFLGGRRDVLVLEDAGGRSLEIDRYAGTLTIAGKRARGRRLASVRIRSKLRPLADISYRPALRAFVDRVGGADVAVPTIEDGVASLRAICAVESAVVSAR
jgi:myo-inositol 2-dehydrogenase/D-chiro-inositol 1-dehydrogenase